MTEFYDPYAKFPTERVSGKLKGEFIGYKASNRLKKQ
jgi:hypothetical protein